MTVRRQGSIVNAAAEGKLLVLKKRFSARSGVDIWSSLVLSLPREEVELMQPSLDQAVVNPGQHKFLTSFVAIMINYYNGEFYLALAMPSFIIE